jgi:hypothetical protein
MILEKLSQFFYFYNCTIFHDILSIFCEDHHSPLASHIFLIPSLYSRENFLKFHLEKGDHEDLKKGKLYKD